MGQLLLKGWAMVGDSCEDCAMPFLKHKGSKSFLCTACQQELAAKIVQGATLLQGKGPTQFILQSKNGKEKFNVDVVDSELKLGNQIV